jgi:metallophosphoesterase (TIGR03768 family)
VRDDIMGVGYLLPPANNSVKLLKFFSITDIHITDKESPSQLIYLQPANVAGDAFGIDLESKVTSVYSPTMLYTTHVLDAVVQTVNALHKQDAIDFGISLGDTCNSTQYNETRWYIDVLDGKVITPSSGVNVGSNTIDYQKPFKAAGLDSHIPWYQAIGNHDHFWLGSIPLDDKKLKINLRASYVSDEVIAMANSLAYASNVYKMDTSLYYMGVLDGSTPTGDIIKAGPVEDFASAPTVVPDVRRRSLTKAQWAQEFFNTTSSPIGHGFNLVPSGKKPDFACYSFIPKSELPIKVIVLDNTQREDDGDYSIHGRGFLDEERWSWLKAELQAGSSNNQLMIIACHVPIAVSPHKADSVDGSDTYMDWYENSRTPAATMENAVTLPDLITELHSHPNLLMWIAGHRHVNTVKAFVHTNAEQGFWQVETSSLHDFPQQMRLFDIRLNSDYTISIHATNVDPAVKEGTPAWTARKYAVAAQQIVSTNLKPNLIGADPKYSGIADPTIKPIDENTGSYNAELLKQLSPVMKAKLQSLFPTI